jgi:cardiolipin synthase
MKKEKIKHYTKISLIFFGALFIITILIIILVPMKDYGKFYLSDDISVGSPEFMSTLSHLVNSPTGIDGSVDKVLSSTDFLPALLSEIEKSSSTIDFTDYPWVDGSFSDQVFSKLTDAAKRGVDVRVVLDSFGGNTVPEKNVTELEDAGGKLVKYHPFNFLDPIQYNERNHMRAIIVDGKTAFIGGIGIADFWIQDVGKMKQWNDLMIEVSGNMAESIQGDFSEIWADATGEVISSSKFYPKISSSKTINSFISIASIPRITGDKIRNAFMLTILSAQKKLYIINPFIIPDQGFLSALALRAKAGVDVRIVSEGENTVVPILRSAWHADYEYLLKAGVKLYEYKDKMIHTKMMLADDTWSLIGSANIDNRSYSINAENMLGISDPDFYKKMENVFLDDLKNSDEITLDNWKNQYGLFDWTASHFWLLFYKQF